jgi:predicted DNA-binding transcriptional regulator AlpA
LSSKIIAAAPAVETATPFLSIEEVAERLRTDVPWVREKIRRRCPNPMPVFNLGRHLVFSWPDVEQWVRNTSRPVHSAHGRRKAARTKKAA